MSNTDSFIEEVTEEVRRDRMFQLLKKWGWLAGLVIVLVVGGAAFNEWRKASARAEAQAFGDAIIAGIEANDDGASLAAVETANPEQAAIKGHLAAADALLGDQSDAGLAALDQVIAADGAPAIYTALAAFKRALALPPETPEDERRAAFEALAAPGAPFQLLAEEQLALLQAEAGDTDAAIERLRGILRSAGLTPGLQRRASELIVALGGDLDLDLSAAQQ
ncbi:hypothetical protein C8N43_0266 [Litoreibacter ponti]|uniref:Tetratricopeptide repeat-like domain-containing protein n=1 Tax=Litoreibacter ponti TaxID=1510457 RepID=A0A2T6BHU0_9RHOB|nr:hypothetical protein [Litoreibacter ponti]PTX55627.1 hypothetical protein C8N43_0266 [Litoreibacter ponti]